MLSTAESVPKRDRLFSVLLVTEILHCSLRYAQYLVGKILFFPWCLPVGCLSGLSSILANMFISIMENQLTLARLICLTSALENCRRKAFLESDSKPTCVLWWFEREPDEISLASLKLAYANALLVHSGTSEKNLCNTSEN